MKESLSRLPAVDRLLRHPDIEALEGALPRPILVRAVREALEAARAGIVAGSGGAEAPPAVPSLDELAREAGRRAAALARPRLRRVVNATGIVVHTNLGRSLLSEKAAEALQEAARRYVTLEYDVEAGARASRQSVVRDLLVELTGAEDALVVNNNAAAVLVALNSLAEGREAVISRGELVEIGGSFRLPEVMAKSGARMVEVGTTNRTRLADYERAITPQTAVLLKVHRSNFALSGFVEEVGIAELAALARERGLVLLHDLGSGVLVDLARAGRAHEPMPQEVLAGGAGVVTFSGDKLLGGPQAGVIVGERRWLSRIAANPLMRAVRVEKLILAALEATLAHYRDEGEGAVRRVPTLAMIAAGEEELAVRARALAGRLGGALGGRARVEVVTGFSEAGGGSLPGARLPTPQVAVRAGAMSAEELAGRLRRGEPPVIGFIRDEAVLLDLRTVQPDEEEDLLKAVAGVLSPGGEAKARGARAPGPKAGRAKAPGVKARRPKR